MLRLHGRLGATARIFKRDFEFAETLGFKWPMIGGKASSGLPERVRSASEMACKASNLVATLSKLLLASRQNLLPQEKALR